MNRISTGLLPTEITVEGLFGTLFDPVVWADPYPVYAELRGRSPVARLDDHLWVASSHAAVRDLLRNPTTSSDERRAVGHEPDADDEFPDAIHQLLVFLDAPDHTRLRSLVVRAFTPRQVRAVEPRAVEIVDRLLDEALERQQFDLVADVAHPLAVQIICELLGVPFGDRERFSEWGSALARVLDPGALRTPEQDRVAAAAIDAFTAYFDDLIAQRRTRPTDDLLSELIAAEADGDRLRLDELINVCLLLLVAGYETTVNLVGNGFVAMMRDRDRFDELIRTPSRLPNAVDELLRIDSPVQMNIRVAVEPVELQGVAIPAGDEIISFIGAANHDTAVFQHPDVLSFERPSNPHLAFGRGMHHCLGAALARVEATAAFAGLTARMPQIELLDAVRRPTFTLRGFESITVRV